MLIFGIWAELSFVLHTQSCYSCELSDSFWWIFTLKPRIYTLLHFVFS
uniref:Uncharacterized protein n=1 Tax=Arundo donax TaxID=35708 RepID=A0A0A9HB31_ARUDO